MLTRSLLLPPLLLLLRLSSVSLKAVSVVTWRVAEHQLLVRLFFFVLLLLSDPHGQPLVLPVRRLPVKSCFVANGSLSCLV